MILRKILKLDKYILEFLIDLFRDFFYSTFVAKYYLARILKTDHVAAEIKILLHKQT